MISSHESSRDSSPRLARDKNFTGNGNARWKIDRMTILLDDSPAFPLDYRTGHGDRERRSWPMDGREKAAFSPRLVANFSREEGIEGTRENVLPSLAKLLDDSLGGSGANRR